MTIALPAQTTDVLRGADLTLRPGEVVGLAVENGAGRLFAAQLLLRTSA